MQTSCFCDVVVSLARECDSRFVDCWCRYKTLCFVLRMRKEYEKSNKDANSQAFYTRSYQWLCAEYIKQLVMLFN